MNRVRAKPVSKYAQIHAVKCAIEENFISVCTHNVNHAYQEA